MIDLFISLSNLKFILVLLFAIDSYLLRILSISNSSIVTFTSFEFIIGVLLLCFLFSFINIGFELFFELVDFIYFFIK